MHVVILINYGMDEYVLDALRAGAAGFLVKDIVPDDFVHAVRVAARGDALLAPSITRKLINQYVAQPLTAVDGTGLDELTSREPEAVTLGRAGDVQRPDRRPHGDRSGDSEDPHQPGHDQIPGPRPRPTRVTCVRIWPGYSTSLLTAMGRTGVRDLWIPGRVVRSR